MIETWPNISTYVWMVLATVALLIALASMQFWLPTDWANWIACILTSGNTCCGPACCGSAP